MDSTSRRVRSPGTITVGALAPVLSAVEASGRPARALVSATGLDFGVFEGAGTRWVPALLTDQLWVAAAERLGHDLPLRLAATAEARSFGLLTYLLSRCDDVGTALSGLTKYYEVLSRTTRYWLEIGGNAGEVGIDLRAERPAVVELFAAAVVVGFLRNQTGVPFEIREVRLIQERPEPELAAAHARAFRGKIRYGSSHSGLVLDASVLKLRLRDAEPPLLAILEDYARERVAGPIQAALPERVRYQIAMRGASCTVRARDVAADLAISERTLRRLLHAEGTSFQAELDALLARVALERLSRAPVEAVAAELGFSEVAAFRRAFRRWYGAPPRTRVSPPTY